MTLGAIKCRTEQDTKCRTEKDEDFHFFSRPLLVSIGCSGQIEEKTLRQWIAYLKEALEEGEISRYSWIEGTEIVADGFTKQGPKKGVPG